MKTKLNASLLIILLSVALLTFANCKQKAFKKITYSGRVIDHTTGQPISGTKIELNACGGGPGDKALYGCDGHQFTIGTATTNNDGYFSITGKAAKSDIYYVYVSNCGSPAGEGVSEKTLQAMTTIYCH